MRYKHLLVIIFVVLHMQFVSAQVEVTPEAIDHFVDAIMTVDNVVPLVGEQATYILTVIAPPDFVIEEWPIFPETQSFMIVQAGDMEIHEQADGNLFYQQRFVAVIWQTGEHYTPQMFVGYRMGGNDEIYRVPVHPVRIDVPSVLDTFDLNETQRKANAVSIAFFYVSPWLVAGGIIVLGALLWLLLRWWKKRRETIAARNALSLPKTPGEIALFELSQIDLDRLSADEVCVQIANTLRRYIHLYFNVSAPEMTTPELSDALQDSSFPLTETRLNELRRLLEQTDIAKFADITPGKRSITRIVKATHRWISTADEEYVSPMEGSEDVPV
jgi:hypothetical protein